MWNEKLYCMHYSSIKRELSLLLDFMVIYKLLHILHMSLEKSNSIKLYCLKPNEGVRFKQYHHYQRCPNYSTSAWLLQSTFRHCPQLNFSFVYFDEIPISFMIIITSYFLRNKLEFGVLGGCLYK